MVTGSVSYPDYFAAYRLHRRRTATIINGSMTATTFIGASIVLTGSLQIGLMMVGISVVPRGHATVVVVRAGADLEPHARRRPQGTAFDDVLAVRAALDHGGVAARGAEARLVVIGGAPLGWHRLVMKVN